MRGDKIICNKPKSNTMVWIRSIKGVTVPREECIYSEYVTTFWNQRLPGVFWDIKFERRTFYYKDG